MELEKLDGSKQLVAVWLLHPRLSPASPAKEPEPEASKAAELSPRSTVVMEPVEAFVGHILTNCNVRVSIYLRV